VSASEKLKGLIHKAETEDYGWDNDMIGEPLVKALPQILAVVEVAEELQPLDHDALCQYFFDPFGTHPCNCPKGRTEDALAALDEALS